MAARTFILASGWRVSSLGGENSQEDDTQTDHQFHLNILIKVCEGYAVAILRICTTGEKYELQIKATDKILMI